MIKFLILINQINLADVLPSQRDVGLKVQLHSEFQEKHLFQHLKNTLFNKQKHYPIVSFG